MSISDSTGGNALPLNIQEPTLLLDRRKAIRNIAKMAGKAQKSGVRFRPHFKTHRSARVGEWFRDFGVEAITVSSVDMAIYFARHGWTDITVAFPVNVLQIHKINDLAREIELGLLIESLEVVQFLSKNLASKANVWIKIDVGYGRTGIPWDRAAAVGALAREVERTGNLDLRGLLTHAGHSYQTTSKEEIKAIHEDSIFRLRQARDALKQEGFPPVELSTGDTPTCSIVGDFSAVDEIRPGNFVFYDLKQLRLGSCFEEEIAVAVACPVVAKHLERSELVLYGGAVHLSKESLAMADGTKVFGRVSFLEKDGWSPMLPDTYVSSLSQEHGIVRTTADVVDRVRIGDVLIVLPVHSCLLAYLLKEYYTLDGTILRSESSV